MTTSVLPSSSTASTVAKENIPTGKDSKTIAGQEKTTFKLSDHGVMAGVNTSDCRDCCTGDLASLGDLCCVIFRMPSCLESLNTQV